MRLALLLLVALLAPAGARPPNVVLILADDLGYGELGCYGQKQILTPEIDRMAAEGLRFTQFYAGATVCAPSRSVLMTGQHTGHTTVRGNAGKGNPQAQTLRPEDVTVAELLQSSGYRNALIGKWGLGDGADSPGHPLSQGFDVFYGYLNQSHAHNQFPSWLWRGREKVELKNDLHGNAEGNGSGYAAKPQEYIGDLMEREALAFLQSATAEKEKPFFLFYSAVVPHANNERTRALGNGQEVPGVEPYTDRPWPEANKALAASITRLDATVGRIRAALRQAGAEQDTLILFSSDNGPHREGGQDAELFDPNGPLNGFKRSLKDGGIRVPFIACWPGTVKPGVSAHIGSFSDLFATCRDLCGSQAAVPAASVSLAPHLRGAQPAVTDRPVLYWEFHESGFSQAVLMDGRWKAIRSARRDAPIELFDLQTDLGEMNDVSAAHPALIDRARGLFTSERKDSPDWPVRDGGAKPARAGNSPK